MIAVDAERRAPVADADLVEQRLAAVVPHLQEPLEPVPGLAREVGYPALPQQRRVVPHGEEHHGLGVARGLDELEIVPRVEPAAGHVDGGRELGEALLGEALGERAARIRRHVVDERLRVVEVGGLAAEDGAIHLGPVVLRLVEEERVGEQPLVERGAGPDAEDRRGRAARLEGVLAPGLHRGEIEGIDVGIPGAPAPLIGPERRLEVVLTAGRR